MGRVGKQQLQSAAFIGLCGAMTGFGAGHAALAAPPGLPRTPVHLDLRPSVTAIAAVLQNTADKPAEGFPSTLHRQPLGAQTQLQLPDLGAQGPQSRAPSRVEEIARRVRKEGLPVARLWENKSALVSLGLNQRGKPGLWIVQKIR